MIRVAVPQIFENMEEATVGRWLVCEGQNVVDEQPLCELITEKVTLELPSPASGIVRRLVVSEKAVVPTHFIVALLGDETEVLPDVDEENARLLSTKPAEPVEIAPPPFVDAPVAPTSSRVRATPAARRAAKDAGVSIDDVAARFPGKVVGEDDVKQFVAGGS